MTSPPDGHFEERLLQALLEEHAALADPALGATGKQAPPPPPQRHRWAAVPVLGVSLTLAALAAAAMILSGQARRSAIELPGARGATPSGPNLSGGAGERILAHQNADYVVRRMLTATEINSAIVVQVEHTGGAQGGASTVHESWWQHGTPSTYDLTIGRHGRPATGTLFTRKAGMIVATKVDYADRTYSSTTYAPSAPGGPAPAGMTLTDAAQRMRAELAAGSATLAGPATVGGRRALKLVVHPKDEILQIYVDPTTYLPIRQIDIPTGPSAHGAQRTVEDTNYLPDTPANRAKLTLAGILPHGFTKASPPGHAGGASAAGVSQDHR